MSTCSIACPPPSAWCAAASRPTIRRSRTSSGVYNRTAQNERFRFFGNVELGRDISVEDPAQALRPHRLRHRQRVGPQDGDSRRGPPRRPLGDRVRRLVQRPPRFPGPQLRPGLGATRRRRRQRQRGDGRDPGPRARPGRTRSDRHHRRVARRAPGERGRGSRPARPQRDRRRRRSRPRRSRRSAPSKGVSLLVSEAETDLDDISSAWLEESAAPSARRNVTYLGEVAGAEAGDDDRLVTCRFLVSPIDLQAGRRRPGRPGRHRAERALRLRRRHAPTPRHRRNRRPSTSTSSSRRSAYPWRPPAGRAVP